MKKVFGILITIVSFLISCYSVVLITVYELKRHYNRSLNGEIQAMGIGLLILGVILFTVGLFLISSKSKRVRAMEIELSNIKYTKQ